MFTEISKSYARYSHDESERKKKMEFLLKNKEIMEREKKAKEDLEERRHNWDKKKNELEKEMKFITAKKASANDMLSSNMALMKTCKNKQETQVCIFKFSIIQEACYSILNVFFCFLSR